MKRDILVPGILAVVLHALVLSGPLPTGSSLNANVYEAVSLSIIHPKPVVSQSSPEEVCPPAAALKPYLPPQPKVAPEQIPVPKRKHVHQETVAVKAPTKERVVTVERNEDVTEQMLVTPKAEKPLLETDQEPVGEPEDEEKPHWPGGGIKEGSALETASVQKYDGHDALQRGGLAPGRGSGEGIVTYAMPTYKEGSRPVYPKEARRRGYEGTVLLEVKILETGTVGQVKIVESSGFRVLDKEAVRWVKTNPFVRGPENGKRIAQTIRVPVTFNLDEGGEEVLAREKRK